MTRALLIAGREIRAYFSSWMAYLVIAGFLALSGLMFYDTITVTRQAEMRAVFHNMAVTLLFVVPILTMRLLAEERRSGTAELLLTSPVTEAQVVMGKFLGALGLLAVMLAATAHLPVLLLRLGSPDPGPLVTGYLGLLLLGAAFAAVGLLASALTESQAAAGFMSFGALLGLWIIDWLVTQPGSVAGQVFQHLSLLNHLDTFSKGVVDTKDIIFCLSFAAVCLLGAVRALESRKWR